ncbi:FACT complex subunit ssrp1 [Guillardia theta CCMP2712]|uniref:FACT complex subunit SSRP1 n=1 Tax=Guillardia theta (strain CCMP2712) TaxID=905079 RepID=L1I8W9_GUITC|nr:FACT complex subunit ssrp1 [Guillardia theta CCMP2712]EKX32716.1 FACT complex subunit ssrp1 [Guillardia theta CCMP2712]|eukprot:XP_005819696.1 FACT complex subunit ssrp1 [Guillardia theta CCMP2712]
MSYTVKIMKADVERAEWCRTGKTGQLRLIQSNGSVTRFEGFEPSESKNLKETCSKLFKVELKTVKVDVQGKNFGKLKLEGEELNFHIDGKKAFDISLSDLSNSQVIPQKDEMVLEFRQTEGLSKRHESLIEMRFYVPPTEGMDEDDADSNKKGVEIFHDRIKEYVSKESGGEKISIFTQVRCRSPKTTFDVSLYLNIFKLHGSSYDFSVKYKHVTKLCKVPSVQGARGTLLILSLDPPLRKGQTMYHHVVLHFPEKDEDDKVPVTLPKNFDWKDIPGKVKDAIQPTMTGKSVDILGSLFQFLALASESKLKVAGHSLSVCWIHFITSQLYEKSQFQSNRDEESFAVSACIGASKGYLYFLDKCFVFLESPPQVIMYEQVETIVFDRKDQFTQSTTFDFKIKLDNGKSQDFNNINKSELKNIRGWFRSVCEHMFDGKKMRIEDDDSDEEEELKDAGNDDDDKHIKNRLAAEAGQDDEDDESSSEDEDFEGKSESSSEESSADEEGSSEGESDEDTKKKSKKAPKSKEVKAKKSKKEEKEETSTKRQKKDPNAPKRPKSAWLLFCDAKREDIVKENPDIKFTEVNGKISEIWKNLSSDEKKPFEEEAAKLASKYKEDKAKYDKENPSSSGGAGKKRKGEDEKEGKAKKAKKDPNAPKRGQNAYMLWSQEAREKMRKANPDLPMKAVMQQLGEKWKEIDAEEKKEWEEKAREDKERFKRETEEYKKKGPSLEEFEKAGEEDSGESEDSD